MTRIVYEARCRKCGERRFALTAIQARWLKRGEQMRECLFGRGIGRPDVEVRRKCREPNPLAGLLRERERGIA